MPITRLTVGALQTNCWIHPLDSETCAVIDPGAEADTIVSALLKLKLAPRYILLTHGHFDHIAALPLLMQSFDSKPQIAVHRLDAEYLGNDSYKVHCRSAAAVMGDTSFIDALWKSFPSNTMPPPDILLEEGDMAGALTVLHIPGHTQGSIALWDKTEGALFTGDTLFAGDYGRTDLPGGSEEQIIASLRRLFTLDGKIKVYPGHGPASTIGKEAGRGLV
ncbi:MAG: MBL fold metallo-hydrolase [Treponema sp.]|jgi:glyoxylase-like metal-dependent hydrolase (beta-lactamase superfamily II)|nr:MBL fold metallo-hydrolase [Treponema sp.]